MVLINNLDCKLLIYGSIIKNMNIAELIAEIQKYDKFSDVALIRKAYEFAKEAHKGQKRESGEDYITHPLQVASILVELLKADGASVCAALLHDVVEMCGIETKEIQKEFGEEIANLVEGLTKKSKIAFESRAEQNAENLRRMLIATTKDIRIILVKLADRLDNLTDVILLIEQDSSRLAWAQHYVDDSKYVLQAFNYLMKENRFDIKSSSGELLLNIVEKMVEIEEGLKNYEL